MNDMQQRLTADAAAAEAPRLDEKGFITSTLTRLEEIASVCHSAIRRLQSVSGDPVSPEWEQVPAWMKRLACEEVAGTLADDTLDPFELAARTHERWRGLYAAEGWKWGPVKDGAKKEHPFLLSWDALPPEQQRKAHVFCAIVLAMA